MYVCVVCVCMHDDHDDDSARANEKKRDKETFIYIIKSHTQNNDNKEWIKTAIMEILLKCT